MEIRKLLEGVSIAGVGYLILATSYVIGYFRIAGIDWVSVINLQEMLSISWVAVPTALLCLAVGAAPQLIKPNVVLDNEQFNVKIETAGRYYGILLRTYRVFVILGTGTFLGLTLNFGTQLANFNPLLPVLVAVLGLLCLNKAIALYAAKEHVQISLIIGLFVGFCLLSYSEGLAICSAKFIGAPQDLMYFSNGRKVCARLLLQAERGDLIAFTYDSPRLFIRADHVVAVLTGNACGK
jgi:hypothetical protein